MSGFQGQYNMNGGYGYNANLNGGWQQPNSYPNQPQHQNHHMQGGWSQQGSAQYGYSYGQQPYQISFIYIYLLKNIRFLRFDDL